MKKPGPVKLKLDADGALDEIVVAAQKAADDRFSRARNVVDRKPTGLSESKSDDVPQPSGAPSLDHTDLRGQMSMAFDPNNIVIGSIVRAPLGIIDPNPVSPRQHYHDDIVDKIAATIQDGQDDAAHGFVKDGRIKLIDGGTRYRSCIATGRDHLEVKIEEEPKDVLELYLRARALNENRSDASALDFALSLEKLFIEKGVTSNQEIVDRVPGPKGGPMTEKTVSCYLRIARRLPPRLQTRMAESEETAKYNALYEVSGLFMEVMDEQQLEERTILAESIIDEIKRKQLSKTQIAALVQSKLVPKKTRERSQVHPLNFANYSGHIKLLESKGKLDMSLVGINKEKLPGLRDKLQELLKDFLD